MKIRSLIWIDEIVEKIIVKHNVYPNEVKETFSNKPYFRFVEKGHIRGENVYSAMGQSDNGRLLSIFFVHKKDKNPLVLSARAMTKAERKRYEKR